MNRLSGPSRSMTRARRAARSSCSGPATAGNARTSIASTAQARCLRVMISPHFRWTIDDFQSNRQSSIVNWTSACFDQEFLTAVAGAEIDGLFIVVHAKGQVGIQINATNRILYHCGGMTLRERTGTLCLASSGEGRGQESTQQHQGREVKEYTEEKCNHGSCFARLFSRRLELPDSLFQIGSPGEVGSDS